MTPDSPEIADLSTSDWVESHAALLEAMEQGYCVLEVFFGEDGKGVDYRFLEVNARFEEYTGIPRAQALSSLTAKQIVPGLESYWAEIYGEVANTGNPNRFNLASNVMGRSFQVSAFRVGGNGSRKVGLIFRDVTAEIEQEIQRKHLAEALELERARLKDIFQQSPAFMAVLRGPDLVFEYANRASYQLLGQRDVLNRPLAEAIPEVVGGGEGQDYDALLRRILKEGREVSFQRRPVMLRRTQDGDPERRYLDMSFKPLRSSTTGEIESVLVHGIDVTEQTLSQKKLTEAYRLLEAHVENAPIGVIEWDSGFRVTRWNNQAESIFGYRAEEVLGRFIHDFSLVHPDDLARVQSTMNDLRQPGNWFVIQKNRNITKNGATVHCEWYNTVVNGDDGDVRSVLSLVLDVTERNAAEASVREMNSILEEKVRERTSELVAKNLELEGFTYSVSHDMRAPLRAIVAHARIVLEEEGLNLSEAGKRHLERLSTASLRMAHLIDDLLQYARLGTREVRRETVDLSDLIHRIAHEVVVEYPGCDMSLDVEAGLSANCDPKLIGLALHNLVDNACKYRQPGEGAHLRFFLVRDSSTADRTPVFCVRDSGIGFDMAFVSKLFQPFERLHRETEYPGTGIGLANVRRAIERPGGDVWAESDPESGTSFYFTLD